MNYTNPSRASDAGPDRYTRRCDRDEETRGACDHCTEDYDLTLLKLADVDNLPLFLCPTCLDRLEETMREPACTCTLVGDMADTRGCDLHDGHGLPDYRHYEPAPVIHPMPISRQQGKLFPEVA